MLNCHPATYIQVKPLTHLHNLKLSTMRTLFILIASLCLALAGCGRDSHSAYIGVWQSLEGTPKTFEISKDAQAFFLQDLRDYNVQGKLNAPMVLSTDGDQLVVKTGLGQEALALRE